MLKDLIKMAGQLDALGFKREADFTDKIIRKVAQETPEGEPEAIPNVEEAYNHNDIKELVQNDPIKFIINILGSKDASVREEFGKPYMDFALKKCSEEEPFWLLNVIGWLKEKVPLTEDEYNKYNAMAQQVVSNKHAKERQEAINYYMKSRPSDIVYKYITTINKQETPYCTEEQLQAALLAVAERDPEMISPFVGFGIVSDEILDVAINSYDWIMENGTREDKWHLEQGVKPERRTNAQLKMAKRR